MIPDYGLCPPLGPAWYAKTPDEGIVIPFYWAARLDGATISSRVFVLPDGLTNAAETTTGSITTIRVTGGDDGGNYRVRAKVTLSDSRVLEQVKRIRVAEA